MASTTDLSSSSSALSRARRRDLRPQSAVQTLHCLRPASSSADHPQRGQLRHHLHRPTLTTCFSADDVATPVVFTEFEGASRAEDTAGFNLLYSAA